MKYLTHYTEEEQTRIFKKYGVFFAFNNQQFAEQKVEGVTYVNGPSGMIIPKEHVDKVIEELNICHEKGIAQDIAENGKNRIIRRELDNYECYYTHDISDAVDALEPYGITEAQVLKVFRNKNAVIA